jgi:hypothetical protein
MVIAGEVGLLTARGTVLRGTSRGLLNGSQLQNTLFQDALRATRGSALKHRNLVKSTHPKIKLHETLQLASASSKRNPSLLAKRVLIDEAEIGSIRIPRYRQRQYGGKSGGSNDYGNAQGRRIPKIKLAGAAVVGGLAGLLVYDHLTAKETDSTIYSELQEGAKLSWGAANGLLCDFTDIHGQCDVVYENERARLNHALNDVYEDTGEMHQHVRKVNKVCHEAGVGLEERLTDTFILQAQANASWGSPQDIAYESIIIDLFKEARDLGLEKGDMLEILATAEQKAQARMENTYNSLGAKMHTGWKATKEVYGLAKHMSDGGNPEKYFEELDKQKRVITSQLDRLAESKNGPGSHYRENKESCMLACKSMKEHMSELREADDKEYDYSNISRLE